MDWGEKWALGVVGGIKETGRDLREIRGTRQDPWGVHKVRVQKSLEGSEGSLFHLHVKSSNFSVQGNTEWSQINHIVQFCFIF